MFQRLRLSAVAFLATSSFALSGYATPNDDLASAAKKVADAGSYSWKSTVENAGGGGGGGRGPGGPTEGQMNKDGVTHLTITRGENTIEAYAKGDKGAIKTPDGWKSLEEATADDGSGQRNPNRMIARVLQNFKDPAAQVIAMASDIKDLKEADGAWEGTIGEEGAKKLLAFGGRRPNADANAGPQISNAKGSAKFWIKDGALAKMEYTVQGTMSFNGNDREINRKTTVEIKDVGSTKIDVPEDAKKKMQ